MPLINFILTDLESIVAPLLPIQLDLLMGCDAKIDASVFRGISAFPHYTRTSTILKATSK